MEFNVAKIIKINKVSDDAISFTLKLDNNWPEFYPGQFCYLKFNNDFNMIRPYSIASDYNTYLQDGIIEFVIKQMPNGLVSNYAKNNLVVNDQINISLPRGNLSIKDKNMNNIIFIAGGSGITMIKTFINHCISTNKNLYLLYGVKFSNQIMFEEYFQSVKSPNFKYKIFISNELSNKYNNGFIDKNIISDVLKECSYDSVIIVGPEVMISKMESNLKEINYSGNIYIE